MIRNSCWRAIKPHHSCEPLLLIQTGQWHWKSCYLSKTSDYFRSPFCGVTALGFNMLCQLSFSDRSLHREEQEKFRQKLPPVGIETWTSGSSGQCLTNWARQESGGQEISRFKVATVCWLSSVGKALAWRSGGPGFKPHWGQLLMIFFCFSLCKNLSDNLTETPIVKNSNGSSTNWLQMSAWQPMIERVAAQCSRSFGHSVSAPFKIFWDFQDPSYATCCVQ